VVEKAQGNQKQKDQSIFLVLLEDVKRSVFSKNVFRGKNDLISVIYAENQDICKKLSHKKEKSCSYGFLTFG
jgi:hypothetical protein